MKDFEKLGAFYLGRPYDLAAGKPKDGTVLYDSRDLVTHAVCVGMTGSGKTGLCIGLIEEAAIDGVPAIVIDPKGDLANLLLTFPDLRAADFRPWINEDDARRKGESPDAYAAQQAELWRNGLQEWGQDGERIRRLRDAADFTIYTPGSSAGIPVSVLGSLSAPAAGGAADAEMLREQIGAAATGLLALLGIDADPVRSREHILLSAILGEAWQSARGVDLPTLIQRIQSPPVSRIGVLELESFYPANERFALAMAVNNLLASPGFGSWLEGEPLDIGRFLYDDQGRPRVAIFSIAHLGDAERMFFVSFLLSKTIAWMRAQSGTTSLRALLYMDEIFGYFPPVANPPSKTPLLTLLKQARAYGLGVILATQNPVDLDYKGLSNAGTWFIGRLQTERDKARVLDGLEGAAAGAGSKFERSEMDRLLSGLGSRVFLMNNVHDDGPEVFQTRWTLSYLRGPLARDQIRALTEPRKRTAAAPPGAGALLSGEAESVTSGAAGSASVRPMAGSSRRGEAGPAGGGGLGRGAAASQARADSDQAGAVITPPGGAPRETMRPVLPPEVPQYFLRAEAGEDRGGPLVYLPKVLGLAQVRFVDRKAGVDETRDVAYATPVTDQPVPVDWDDAREAGVADADLEREPQEGARYAALAGKAARPASYAAWSKEFAGWLQRDQRLDLMRSAGSGEVSRPGESERDFRVRLQQTGRERRDRAIEDLRRKYAPRKAALEERLRRAGQAKVREAEQARQQQVQTAISVGATLLGAFLGRRAVSTSTVGRATTAARGVGRSMKEAGDVARAQETVEAVHASIAELDAELRAETEAMSSRVDPLTESLEAVALQPARKDISVRLLALLWTP